MRPATDAGTDAATDGGQDAATPDVGPVCAPACGAGLACCPDGTGTGICTATATDVANCGLCGFDCRATGRGDLCRRGQCACGSFDLGCLGRFTNFCCVDGPGEPHCANLAQDIRDCGGCGRACDPLAANDCEGGVCVCGERREACRGTPDDRCCADRGAFYDCVDTTRSPDHCGGCGRRCPAGQRCVDGTCTP